MSAITVCLPEKIYNELQRLSRQYYRSLESEIIYRLDQAIRYRTHVSDDDVGLFSILSKLQQENEDEALKKYFESKNDDDPQH